MFRDFENVLLAQLGRYVVKAEKDHFGKMLMNATVCEQIIRYPTDLSLLNQVGEISEKLTDALHHIFCQDPVNKSTRKPRTYRNWVHKVYLKYAKTRRWLPPFAAVPFGLSYCII